MRLRYQISSDPVITDLITSHDRDVFRNLL